MGHTDTVEPLGPALGENIQPAGINFEQARVFVGDVQAQTINKDPVEGRIKRIHRVIYDTRATLDLKRHDIGHDVACDADKVRSQAADNRHGHVGCCRLHIEAVVAFKAVNFGSLNCFKADVQTRAKDALFGDQEAVISLGAKNDNRVGPCPAINRKWCVDIVKEAVIAAAAKGFGIAAACDLGRITFQNEGTDHEDIVTVFAKQLGQTFIRIDVERVITQATKDDHRVAVAYRQEALGGFIGLDLVAKGNIRKHAIRTKHLADLERVHTCATIKRDDRRCIVGV